MMRNSVSIDSQRNADSQGSTVLNSPVEVRQSNSQSFLNVATIRNSFPASGSRINYRRPTEKTVGPFEEVIREQIEGMSNVSQSNKLDARFVDQLQQNRHREIVDYMGDLKNILSEFGDSHMQVMHALF